MHIQRIRHTLMYLNIVKNMLAERKTENDECTIIQLTGMKCLVKNIPFFDANAICFQSQYTYNITYTILYG